jgi:hypothetical protein
LNFNFIFYLLRIKEIFVRKNAIKISILAWLAILLCVFASCESEEEKERARVEREIVLIEDSIRIINDSIRKDTVPYLYYYGDDIPSRLRTTPDSLGRIDRVVYAIEPDTIFNLDSFHEIRSVRVMKSFNYGLRRDSLNRILRSLPLE